MNMLTSLKDMLSTAPSLMSLGKGGNVTADPSQGGSDFAQMMDTLSVPSKAVASNAAHAAPAAPVMLDMPAMPDGPAGPPVALDMPAAPNPAPATPVASAALDMPAAPVVQAKADAAVLPATPAPLALPTAVPPEPAAQDTAPLPSVADDQPTNAAAPSKIATPVAHDAKIASPVIVALTAKGKPAPPPPSADPAATSIATAPTTRPIASEPVVLSDDGDADDTNVKADQTAPIAIVMQPLANAVPISPPIAVAPTTPQATKADSAPAPISMAPTAPKALVQSPIAAETVAPGALPIVPAKPEQAISAKSRPANASPVPPADAQVVAPEAAVVLPDIVPTIPHAQAPASMPATAAAPQAAKPSPDQPVTEALASLVAPTTVSREVAIPLPAAAPVTGSVADASATTPTPGIVTAQPADAPILPGATLPGATPGAALAALASSPVQASSRPTPATTIQPAAAAPTAAPVKPASFERVSRSDAVSLLQLARDHMAGRVAPSGKDDAARPSITAGAPSTDAASLPTSGIGRIDSATIQPSAPTMQPATSTPTTTAVVNLSASLGAQVVDMGVSGQWIDGLARDIAGLSANGAQGRFQIQADQLGPVQVDIRPGDGGSSVVLTVENAVAEAALRRDSDQLRFDVGGSAARISDVRIERGPTAADATRSDQSSTQQQSAGQGQASSWQGQNAAQQQQARSQARDNPFANPKGTVDAVVINHGQTGDAGEPARARYA